MSRANGYRLNVMIFGLAVCLTMPACRTCTETAYDDTTVSEAARETRCKLNELIIPEMAFPLHATISDAVAFLKQASREYDTPWRLSGERGVRFDLHLPPTPQPIADPFTGSMPTNPVYAMGTAMSIRSISLHDALQLVCEISRMSWHISEDGKVVIKEIVWPDREEWVTRSYTVPPELADALFTKHDGQVSDVEPNKAWELFFEQLGVPRPSVRTNDVFQCTCGKTHRDLTEYVYQPISGTLRVTNTPWNLAIIDQVFKVFALRKVEVEMQIHAFRTADIERLRLAGGVSLEALMELRQNGKAKPIASATALTKSGQEAIVKAVREVIYPTELLAKKGQADSNMTVRSAVKALMPGNFIMRETGMILQVNPEVSAFDRSQIHLTMKPQWISLEGWESYPADQASGWTHHTLSIKQPVFGVTSFETKAAVKDGGTILVGSCSTLDGEWVHVGFLTARRMDNQVAVSDKKALQQQARRDAEVLKKLKHIVIPEVTFCQTATIFDAVRFFKEASITYDKTTAAKAQRGVNFGLRLYQGWTSTGSNTHVDPFVAPAHSPYSPAVPAFSAHFINLYDALKLVCDVTGMKFNVRNGVVWINPENTGEYYLTRIYPAPSSYPSTLFERRTGAYRCADDNDKRDWAKFYERLCKNCAMDSSISYQASVNLLRVKSSPMVLDEFEALLEDVVYSRKVEVDVQIHAFPTEEIKQMRLSGDISVEALMTLRKKGKSRQVASATVVTKSGQEACVKAVREVIYPTDLSSISREGAGVLVPSEFEMREVGMALKVMPELDASGLLINLTMKPEWVTLEGWKTYPADRAVGWTHKRIPFKQPIFATTSFETQTLVEAGKTVLFGSSSTPDGKWVHVGFLTVK